jgi:hypothetical protein
MFVWLGSGRTRKRHVGGLGRFLDEAARAGLPVPAGAVLLDEFYRFCLGRGLAQRTADQLIIPDIELWHNTLFHSVRLPTFDRPVAVRPSFSADGGGLMPNPLARQWVSLNDPVAAADAFSAIWTVAVHFPATTRADTLIIEMVTAEHAGCVNLSDGEADEITVASPSAATLRLPRLLPLRAPDESLPPYARRLQMLVRGLRRTFGPAVRQVEWADDGAICYVLGAPVI